MTNKVESKNTVIASEKIERSNPINSFTNAESKNTRLPRDSNESLAMTKINNALAKRSFFRKDLLSLVMTEIAQESYIAFVDSDDVIALDYFSNLIFCLEANGTIAAKTKNVYKFLDESYNPNIFHFRTKKQKGKIKNLAQNLAYKTEPWRVVYKITEKTKSLRFPSVRNGEDVPFGICLNAIALNVAFCASARYFYRNRAQSLSKNYVKNEKEPKHCDYDFSGFKFILDFFIQNKLYFCVPTDMIRPQRAFLLQNENYFIALQKALKSWNIPKEILELTPTLNAVLHAKNACDFLNQTETFREKFKQNFRIKFNKREKIIKIFGKILYRAQSSTQNKWSN